MAYAARRSADGTRAEGTVKVGLGEDEDESLLLQIRGGQALDHDQGAGDQKVLLLGQAVQESRGEGPGILRRPDLK